VTDLQSPRDIEDLFRDKGIPFTRQRRLIWEYFAGSGRAATIAEAAGALRGEGVGQATVYRAVTLLGDLGLLARVQDGHGEICYTAPPIGHSHPLICGSCRKVVRFAGDGDVSELESVLTAETGFAIYGHHLEIYGICPECQAAQGAEPARPENPS
jgi:Fur family peroxide stress response transcriptional regulator